VKNSVRGNYGLVTALVVLGSVVACTSSAMHRSASAAVQPADPTPAAAAAPAAAQQLIQHVSPRRDSVGPQPKQFEWTAVVGADTYAMGIWNEVDRMVFRVDNVPGTTYSPPAELQLEAGTYFWTVTAVHDDQEIASSGLAAFVVRTDQ
jgi:hypothetical protein